MNCPTCGRKIPAEDINIQRMAAHCRACAEVFSFADRFQAPAPGGAESRDRVVPPRPPALSVEETGGRLVISFRWATPALFMIIPFTIAWNGFLVFWYYASTQVPGPFKWFMLLFPIAHVAAGLFLTHLCLTGLFNRTTITVDRTSLAIRHGPIPAGRNIVLQSRELDQLFCRGETATDSDGDITHRYSLHVLLKNGTRQDLLIGQADRDLTRYLEYAIEHHLGIVDRPVAGEGDSRSAS